VKKEDQKWKKIVLKKYLEIDELLEWLLFLCLLTVNQLLELTKLYKTIFEATSKKKKIVSMLLEKKE
jgi:hypothetical protein